MTTKTDEFDGHGCCTWRVGPLSFHLMVGNIFDIPVDAIVNSEQTDFYLADTESTVSGQIRLRFGEQVQRELFEQTDFKTLAPGTVLRTGSGLCGTYEAIFHAGYHAPEDWFMGFVKSYSAEDAETEFLQAIRTCVHKILASVCEDPLIHSVAFPLIGAGLFGLSLELVAHGFFEDVIQFASGHPTMEEMEVWLVIYDPGDFCTTVESGVQAWLAHTATGCHWEALGLGVSYLDLFESQLVRESHPKYAAWMHVRYAELIVGYAASVLAVGDGVLLEDVVHPGIPITFGGVRTLAKDLARGKFKSDSESSGSSSSDWHVFLADAVKVAIEKGIIKRINDDRNNIAHGKEARSAQKIREDIVSLLQVSQWKALSLKEDPPDHDALSPWAVARNSGEVEPGVQARRIGVLVKWKPGCRSYLIPWSGAHFEVIGASSSVDEIV